MKKAWVHNNIKLRAALMRRDDLIRSQAHWYESILDVLPFPVRISDAETNWMFVNAAAERLFGIKRGDMLGKPCDHNKFCICGTDNCSLERAKRGLFQTAFGHEGSSYQVEVEVLRDKDGELSGFIEMIHDVTETANAARMQADAANKPLRETEERVRLMLDATPLACRLWDRNYKIIECNEAALNLYGLKSKQEYIDRFFDLLPEYQPNGQRSIDIIYGGVAKAFEKGSYSYEVMFRSLDGEPIPAENMLFRVRYGEDYVVAAYTRDLREQKKMMDEIEYTSARLQQALAEAEIANKAKSLFLANMSHEIRTPMNAILGITEIMVRNESLPENIMDGLNKIHASCGLLLGIINDVLDFSKIEAGKLDITPAAYQLASMVNDTINLNMMRIGEKPIEFKLMIDDKVPAMLTGDELRIKQILNNLLSNAFKYTDAGTVTLSVSFEQASEEDVTLILGVEDTGHGITEKQLEKIFDEYTRFLPDTNRVIEGTGLGMAITQRLVRLMNGEISVESEPGRGSLFTVRLPQKNGSVESLGTQLAENLRCFKMPFLTDSVRMQPEREYMPYGRVLVVDDMENNLYVAVGLLKLYGLQTDTAMSGAEAVDKIKRGNVYDVVFMDHMMPGMDGIQTAKHLHDLGYREPIVALTANAVATQANLFLKNGFDDFIAKPIDMRQLDAVLIRLVRDKQPPEVVAGALRQRDSAKDAAYTVTDTMLYAAFLRDARKALKILEEWRDVGGFVSTESLRLFTITAHAMKSALANIGEPALSQTARELEAAGKNGNVELIKKVAPGFLDGLCALIDKAGTEAAGERGGDSEADAAYLREKLIDVQKKCEDYDRKCANDILAELGRKKCSRRLRGVLDSIMEAVLHSDFEEAGEIAASCAASLGADGVPLRA